MMAAATLSPILVIVFVALMSLIGGTVQVTNPKKNPKKKGKAKKKKSKKKAKKKKTGKKKAKRTAKQKAASKRNIKKAQAARRGKGKKKKSKKKKTKKKGKRKRKKTTRRTSTTTTTTRTNKKRKRKRKTNKKRKRKRKSNPKLKGFKKVKSYFPSMKGKATVGDAAGAFTGIVVGSSLSGITKMATESPAAGVAVHGASWIGGTLIINNTKKLGKKAKRQKFARGWFVGDGIAFGVDAGVEIFKYLTESPTAILKLSDLEDADWKDKIKTVFMTGVGNPLEVAKKKSGNLSDYDDFDEFASKFDPRNWSTPDLLDELYGYDDLTDDELALIAEVEELEGLGEYATPTQEAASQVLV